jgi:hypothetical protein
MLLIIILLLFGVFSLFSEFDFDQTITPLDDSFDVNKYIINKNLRLYVCYFIILLISIFLTYFTTIDYPLYYNEDFENFKSLMKEHGLEWSDLFSKPKDNNNKT